MRGKEVFLQKQQKKLQNSVFHLGNQSRWHQLKQVLRTKLPVIKCSFFLEKRFNFESWENGDVLHIIENLTTINVLQSICRVSKMPFTGKKETLLKLTFFQIKVIPKRYKIVQKLQTTWNSTQFWTIGNLLLTPDNVKS